MPISRRAVLQGALIGAFAACAAQANTDKTRTLPLRFMKLRHGALVVEVGGRLVLVDPWLSRGPGSGLIVSTGESPIEPDGLGRIDLILLTSSTPDRLSSSTLRALPEKRARCLVPDERSARVCREAGFERVRVIEPDERLSTVGLEITTFVCRPAGLLPISLGFHVAAHERSVLIAGALLPLVVDDAVGRFARDHAAEIAFLPRPDRAIAPGDLAASDDDLILIARLARARAVVPIADAVRAGPLAAPLVDIFVEPRSAVLTAPAQEDDVTILDFARSTKRARMPRALHVENGVWYRMGVDEQR
jgi:L-ascorbate metabolism protein UlaG (beta-lactamase superfamily)